MPHNTSHSGFTLIELCIVLALVSIIAGLSIAGIEFFNRLLVRSEIEQLYSAVMYVQRCAQVSNSTQSLVLDPRNQCYYVDGDVHKLPEGVRFGSVAGVKGPPSAPLKTIVNPITFTDNTIACAPMGIVQSGTVYLVNAQKNIQYALSSGISSYSYLRKYYHDGTWHVIER